MLKFEGFVPFNVRKGILFLAHSTGTLPVAVR